MTPDLFWIPGPWTGRLAIAARPRGGDWLDDEASGWRRAGLDVVVSLLEEEEAGQLGLTDEDLAAAANGIRFVSFPIADRGVPASNRRAIALLRDIAGALEDGKNVAVHCRQGIGRSGLVAAAALVTAGMSADSAIETVSAARGRTVPETEAQHRWVHHLPSERLVEAV
ncbi:MAG: dual specificity protein phosphatase family protein [Bryobacteraceae bacterium]|jgi:protein-tyrosine phosphatase